MSSLLCFCHPRSKKVAALATTLQQSSLQKKDLELELDELENAAALVAAEEQQVSNGAAECCADSSSSESSSDSEDPEAEGQGSSGSEEGGGGGGETCKDNPPQLQPTSSVSPTHQMPTSAVFSAEKRKVDTPLSASEGCRRLIEELRISPNSSLQEERRCSQPSDAAEAEETSGRSSAGNLLEPNPRRNPLLIVQTQEHQDLTS